MNNIFKVIWNHATQTWTAVGELASAKGKSKSIKLTAISAALLMACGTAQAATHKAADDLVAIDNAAAAAVPADEKPQALGSNAIAVGRKAKAETANSVAIGPSAEVLRQPGVPYNSNGIAIGAQARIEPKVNGNADTSTFHNSIAIGTRTLATASHAIVIGQDASSMRNQAAATYQTGENIVAIGNRARADWEKSIAIGTNASTVSPEAIAVGTNSMASGGGNKGGVAIGSIAHANHVGTVAVGSGSNASNVNSMAMGFHASSVGRQAVTVGNRAFSRGDNAVTIGDGAMSGWNSANRAVTVGANSRTVTDDGLSVGYNAFAGNFRSTAIGKNAVSYGAQALALGSEDLGGNASAANIYKKNTMAIGKNSSAVGTNSIATGDNNIAFGTGATSGVAQASVDSIKTAYADYRKAYETYANLDKTAENAKANAGALKTIVADLSTNLRIFHDNYTQSGVLYKHADEFKTALQTAGLSFDELGTLTSVFTKEPNGSDANIAKIIAKKADIEKIANIKNTAVGGQNERLAHLVALAKNLSNKITELEKANTASATAAKALTDGKAAHDAAKTAFETSYAGKNATNAIAIGASSETASNSSTAVGHKAKVNGVSPNAVAIGTNTRAGESGYTTRDGAKRFFTTDAANATVVGSNSLVALENSTAVGYDNIVRAKNAGAFGTKNRIGEWDYEITGADKASATPKEGQTGENSFVVGSNNGVWAKNVMVLGNNVRVYGIGTRKENRENAVVLGNNSDGAPTVKKVNSANVNGMVYSGFKGNLGATKTDGSEAEKADNELQGRFVSIGAATTDKDGATVYGERQIKHVAAGEISSTSTDAINGSQLYAVASGLRDAFPVVYTDAAGNKVVKYPDGNYYPEGTTFNADGTPSNPAVTNVIASMNNPTNTEAGKAGDNVTLTNVAQGANTIAYEAAGNPLVKVGDSYYAPDQFENGKLKATATPTPSTNVAAAKDPVKEAKTGLADLKNSVASNALTVADAKNLGWVVSADSKDGKGYADKVTNANEVRFNGKNGIKVTGETDKTTGIRNINIELEKSDVVKTGEYKIGDKTYVNVDGKLYDKDSIDPKTNKPKADAASSNYAVQDGKVMDNSDAANPKEVAGVDNGSNFVDGNTVYKAIQESGWTVGKAKDALANNKFEDKDEKVNPNDEVRFADGKGITVKTATVDKIDAKGDKQTTTVVKFDTDLPIDYVNVKNAAGDTLKQANDGNWYKEADVNNDGTVKLTNNKAPEVQKPVKTGATLSDANSNMGKNPYRTAIEDKAMAAAIEKVRGENPTATVEELLPKVLEEAAKQVAELEKAEKTGKDKDVITAGKDGVQLNNVGWAENPDQAVNKDQLDQTVNKSGFFIQQNGKTTVENAANKEEKDPAKSEKVTPNDVVNFVNGKGTVIKAVTKRDANGVDTTTVSVDVDTSALSLPKGANTIAYNDKGEQIVNVNGKYYKPSDLENGKPTATATEQTPVVPAAADKPLEAAKDGLADLAHSDGDNLLSVKDAQNLGWVVSTSDNNKAAPVKNADVVDFKAEPNTGITVKGDVKNGKMTVTVGNDYFKANATGEAAKATGPNSVAIGGNSNAAVEDAVAIGNGAAVKPEAAKGSVAIGAGAQAGKAHTGAYSLAPSATVAGQPSDATRVVSVGSEGNEAQIQNVAAGVVSNTSTDAVNGSQLHATNVQVNKNAQNINRVEGKVDNLSQVINNHAGEFNRLDRKVNKYGKEARAGIAGANAAAALPQVYTPGKSMVAAAAGTFKGQNALAVGYSRASDNGKVILKLQGNANTSGDVGAGVGVGYQW
ncbi:YadA-like family protein [Haemophilus sp. oral taxon 851]|uniref:YadA-like family protein n=1 Tax=Haemophilus sp. oral taxon 851 TaxID=762964 RepID=UPI00024623CE|nr:YadA-like family protein [Haemophilus sp. oral taxon 851]EHO46825.1 Hep/Hag repeat protein [Haemophilus sp. oral taxon 851 str. F0397]